MDEIKKNLFGIINDARKCMSQDQFEQCETLISPRNLGLFDEDGPKMVKVPFHPMMKIPICTLNEPSLEITTAVAVTLGEIFGIKVTKEDVASYITNMGISISDFLNAAEVLWMIALRFAIEQSKKESMDFPMPEKDKDDESMAEDFSKLFDGENE